MDAIRATIDAGMVRETHRLNNQMVLLTIAIVISALASILLIGIPFVILFVLLLIALIFLGPLVYKLFA